MRQGRKYNFNREDAHDSIIANMKEYFGSEGDTKDFVIGLSGGIDSALVAYFAAEAFGKKHVHGLILPSNTTSETSVNLALKLAENLEIDVQGLPVGKLIDDFASNFEKNYCISLSPLSKGNISARLRMISLMTASNEFGWHVLNTGNRTEAMLGYCTLFGDTVGEYSPIGDVFKTEVYQLAEMANLIYKSKNNVEAIPQEIIERPATAELVQGQTDESEIGANYATIDRILWGRFVQEMTIGEFVAYGFNEEVLRSILKRIENNAFKARFYAPHPVIHPELN